ncbi:hypothetical protein JOF29_001701 [Kribbella aluminosa]|uniref:DUF2510 domain-containing protein n=1 Tax=Kribbella aluminosa TaxID=416017 RepID=A0ABS4UG36_9ACTN|nr:hypothetical protein [Kribbella aluminosa]MBP2350618.1 hypothetical protein [Kribbella aluminosa]
MPTYSDDGQWWWDGRSWQPISTLPPQQAPQQAPYPPAQQAPYPPPQQPGNPKPPRKRRGVIWAVVAAVLLVIAVPAGIFGWRALSKKDDGTAGAPHGKTIEPGQPVTAQALSEVDPATFFEGMASRQMTQPLGRLKVSYFESQQKFLARSDSWTITDSVIDHKTDKFYFATTSRANANDNEPTSAICKGGKSYSWNHILKTWQVVPFDSPECSKKQSFNTGDSLFSSGLTPGQAGTVLAKLRSYSGYVNPAKPTLLSAGGRTYVRQVVDFKPVVLTDAGYGGTAISMWAFRDAGLDPVTWPWSNPYPLGVGIHAVYYLDAKTLLPVATFEKGIGAPAYSGGAAIPAPGIQVINYSFPKTLPAPVLNNSPQYLSLLLPQGWKVQ